MFMVMFDSYFFYLPADHPNGFNPGFSQHTAEDFVTLGGLNITDVEETLSTSNTTGANVTKYSMTMRDLEASTNDVRLVCAFANGAFIHQGIELSPFSIKCDVDIRNVQYPSTAHAMGIRVMVLSETQSQDVREYRREGQNQRTQGEFQFSNSYFRWEETIDDVVAAEQVAVQAVDAPCVPNTWLTDDVKAFLIEMGLCTPQNTNECPRCLYFTFPKAEVTQFFWDPEAGLIDPLETTEASRNCQHGVCPEVWFAIVVGCIVVVLVVCVLCFYGGGKNAGQETNYRRVEVEIA
jgi:hypothetical protein